MINIIVQLVVIDICTEKAIKKVSFLIFVIKSTDKPYKKAVTQVIKGMIDRKVPNFLSEPDLNIL